MSRLMEKAMMQRLRAALDEAEAFVMKMPSGHGSFQTSPAQRLPIIISPSASFNPMPQLTYSGWPPASVSSGMGRFICTSP
jgi:hypothetical protein